MIDTTKKGLFFCAPAWNDAKAISTEAPAPKRFPVLAHVRVALACAIDDEEKYGALVNFFKGGEMTGLITGDRLFLAQQLVLWEDADGREALAQALKAGAIKLNDIATRIVPELRRTLFVIESGVITGQRLTADSGPIG
jgi:hypothetical protein